MNISGVMVRTYPEKIDSVGKILSAMAGVEVHGNNEAGKTPVFCNKKSAATGGQDLERLPTMIIVICIKSVPLRTANSNL